MRPLPVGGLVVAIFLSACSHGDAPIQKRSADEFFRYREGVWIVFFDSGKAALSREALSVVAIAADAYRSYDIKRWLITGFCDTAETGCKKLGMARAQAVADRLGVRRSQLELRASPNDLLILTGPGVAEQMNRRVQIEALE